MQGVNKESNKTIPATISPYENRRFPEITGEIIWKSEAPAVGHRFTHRLLAWSMISEWRRQSKSAGL